MKNPSFFSNFRGDLFGGMTAGIVALPLALAFGKQTELGPMAGLYGAIAMSILTPLLASTRPQVSGPTAPMTVVSVQAIAEAIRVTGSVATAFPFIVAMFFLAGFFQFILGCIGFGRYVKYMPYPVVSGFMSGIGVMIIITQIFPLVGGNAPSGGALGTLALLPDLIFFLNPTSFCLAIGTIVLIYLFPYLTKKVPSSLLALIAMSALSFYVIAPGTFDRIDSAGPIPTGMPTIKFEIYDAFMALDKLAPLLRYSVILAFLASVDSLLTSVMVDKLLKERHDSNRELMGHGLSNMSSALIGGLPGASATMRTMINIRAGGRGKLSGVIAGLLLFGVLLGLGPLISIIPNAVLAGILLTVGIGILDWHGLRQIRRVPRTDSIVMFTVIFLTVFVDLITAVGAGVLLASLFFMKKTSDSTEERSATLPLEEFPGGQDEASFLQAHRSEVYVQNFDGPLFFGSAIAFTNMIQSVESARAIIIHMERVPYLDQSGLHALEDALSDLKEKGTIVTITGLQSQPRELLEKTNVIPELLSANQCFETFSQCAEWLEVQLGAEKTELDSSKSPRV